MGGTNIAFSEGILVTITSMLVVFIVLIIIAAIIHLLKIINGEDTSVIELKNKTENNLISQKGKEISPELRAVISAALVAYLSSEED